jgi:hypothetical protein
MLQYRCSALVASLLVSLTAAIPYVTPPEKNVPVPQLHYSKAPEFLAESDDILSENITRVHSTNAAAYSLVDTYNANNWMSKFSVQNVYSSVNASSPARLTAIDHESRLVIQHTASSTM